MFNESQSTQPKKILAISALVISFLSIGLLIIGRLINMSDSAASYSSEGEAIRHVSTIIMILFAVLSLTGFLISMIALVKSLRKPELYAGKGIAITALILNGIFSLISIGVILVLLRAILNYFFSK